MSEQVIKYFLGKLSEEEQVRLLRKRYSDPEIKKDFASCQNMLAIFSLSPGPSDKEDALKKLRLLKQTKGKKNIRRIVYTSAGYAAAICLLIVSTWFWARSGMNHGTGDLSAGQQELFVPAGQRARITLPDGTIAWLNAGSTLIYPSVFAEERMVSLTGEAYFDVSKDKEKPFIVSTETIHIKALGTQFNVYSYPKTLRQNTILVDGKIKIYKPGFESDGIILSPNQQLFCKNGEFRLESFQDQDVLLWKDGIYSFKNERLDAIIEKLELYFDVDIIIESPSLLEKEYTGKFRQKDGVMEILRIIQKIHPFRIDKNEKLNQITLRR
jgi:ferric-dicitrate binding protein FerR (iron transport regulator)